MPRMDMLSPVRTWREQLSPQVRLLAEGGARLLAAIALAEVALGLLQVAVIVAIAAAIAYTPLAAVSSAGSSADARVVLALALAAGAFCLLQLLAPFGNALGNLLQRKVDGYCIERLMTGALRQASYSALEESRVQDPLTNAAVSLESAWSTPGAACAGLMSLLARYVQLVAALVLLAAFYSPWLALLLLVVALLIRHGRRSWQRRERLLWRDLAAARRKVLYLRRLGLGPAAAKEIRTFALLDWLREYYRRDTAAFLGPLSVQRRRLGMRPFFYYSAIAFAVGVAAFILTVQKFTHGQLSLFDFILFLQILRAALLFGDNFPECDDNLTYGNRGYHFMLDFEQAAGIAAPTSPDADGTGTNGRLRMARPGQPQAVRLEHVNFRYGPDDPLILRDLCLTLPAGASTAIVGLNGAGKTTIIKLLAKLYEPTSGQIIVGDTDLADLAEPDWHRQISIIFQDFNRYELSAADNIGFGSVQHMSDSDGIRAAASEAGVLDAIESLPDGIHTPLSRQLDGGAELSGGQWQRIALARAIFAVRHGARLLVLDEPTAQLDVRAEVEFFDHFLDLASGTTSVVISHRFSTVRRADCIVVLEDGHIAESGTHAELIRLGGRYATLFNIQAQNYQSAAETFDYRGAQ